jgi:hypothetical protein
VSAMNSVTPGGAVWPPRLPWIRAGDVTGDSFVQDLVTRLLDVAELPPDACFGHALFRCTGPQFGGLLFDLANVQSEAYIQCAAVESGIGADSNWSYCRGSKFWRNIHSNTFDGSIGRTYAASLTHQFK